MRKYYLFATLLFMALLAPISPLQAQQDTSAANFESMMVRIAEIEIFPEYLKEYYAILKQEATASVVKEPGVIAIFPMFIKEDSTQIRIIEIYANKAAYQSHLKTEHFLHYKSTTLNMVKALKLVEMQALDTETMQQIFKKMKG